jgi:hypothetical protein
VVAAPGRVQQLQLPVEVPSASVQVALEDGVVVGAETWSMVAATLARITGWYSGASRMLVIRPIRLVAPAAAARLTSESWLG